MNQSNRQNQSNSYSYSTSENQWRRTTQAFSASAAPSIAAASGQPPLSLRAGNVLQSILPQVTTSAAAAVRDPSQIHNSESHTASLSFLPTRFYTEDQLRAMSNKERQALTPNQIRGNRDVASLTAYEYLQYKNAMARQRYKMKSQQDPNYASSRNKKRKRYYDEKKEEETKRLRESAVQQVRAELANAPDVTPKDFFHLTSSMAQTIADSNARLAANAAQMNEGNMRLAAHTAEGNTQLAQDNQRLSNDFLSIRNQLSHQTGQPNKSSVVSVQPSNNSTSPSGQPYLAQPGLSAVHESEEHDISTLAEAEQSVLASVASELDKKPAAVSSLSAQAPPPANNLEPLPLARCDQPSDDFANLPPLPPVTREDIEDLCCDEDLLPVSWENIVIGVSDQDSASALTDDSAQMERDGNTAENPQKRRQTIPSLFGERSESSLGARVQQINRALGFLQMPPHGIKHAVFSLSYIGLPVWPLRALAPSEEDIRLFSAVGETRHAGLRAAKEWILGVRNVEGFQSSCELLVCLDHAKQLLESIKNHSMLGCVRCKCEELLASQRFADVSSSALEMVANAVGSGGHELQPRPPLVMLCRMREIMSPKDPSLSLLDALVQPFRHHQDDLGFLNFAEDMPSVLASSQHHDDGLLMMIEDLTSILRKIRSEFKSGESGETMLSASVQVPLYFSETAPLDVLDKDKKTIHPNPSFRMDPRCNERIASVAREVYDPSGLSAVKPKALRSRTALSMELFETGQQLEAICGDKRMPTGEVAFKKLDLFLKTAESKAQRLRLQPILEVAKLAESDSGLEDSVKSVFRVVETFTNDVEDALEKAKGSTALRQRLEGWDALEAGGLWRCIK